MDLATLLGGLRAASLDTGETITADQARRLACEAGIIPAVLGGRSQVLDLGRTRRFHTKAQRIAMGLEQGGCTAEGCDWPPGLCHAHHEIPWGRLGGTSVEHGMLLPPPPPRPGPRPLRSPRRSSPAARSPSPDVPRPTARQRNSPHEAADRTPDHGRRLRGLADVEARYPPPMADDFEVNAWITPASEPSESPRVLVLPGARYSAHRPGLEWPSRALALRGWHVWCAAWDDAGAHRTGKDVFRLPDVDHGLETGQWRTELDAIEKITSAVEHFACTLTP